MSDDYLKFINQDIAAIKNMMADIINALREAESEVPEKMRRFIMYYHDMHDIVNFYHENGQQAPKWIVEEVQRCDDRLRQLLKELHTDTGAFEKVRQNMANDPENRYDHTRQLFKPKVQP